VTVLGIKAPIFWGWKFESSLHTRATKSLVACISVSFQDFTSIKMNSVIGCKLHELDPSNLGRCASALSGEKDKHPPPPPTAPFLDGVLKRINLDVAYGYIIRISLWREGGWVDGVGVGGGGVPDSRKVKIYKYDIQEAPPALPAQYTPSE
jgi:hypothetical protein